MLRGRSNSRLPPSRTRTEGALSPGHNNGPFKSDNRSNLAHGNDVRGAAAASASFKEAAELVIAYAVEVLELKHKELLHTMEASYGLGQTVNRSAQGPNSENTTVQEDAPLSEQAPKLNEEEYALLPSWERKVTVETAQDLEADKLARLQYRSGLEQMLDESAVLKDHMRHSQPKGLARLVCSPTTPRRVLWDLVGAIFLIFDAVIIPLAAFDLPEDGPLFMVRLAALGYWTLDIFASFTLGYYRHDGELEMRLGRVARHYLFRLFFLDLVLVGCDWAIDGVKLLFGSTWTESGADSSGLVRFFKFTRVIRLLRIIRAFRLMKLRRVLSDIQDTIGMERSAIMFSLCVNILKIGFVTHYLACLWYWTGTTSSHGWLSNGGLRDKTWHHSYLMSLHWSIANFTPGSSGAQPQSTQEYLMAVLVLYFAMVIFSIFVSSTTSLINRLVGMKAARNKQILVLKAFMKQNNFDPFLRHRVLRYVDASLGKRSRGLKQEEVELFKHLSGHLLEEVQMHLHFGTLGQHPLFRVLALENPMLARKLSVEALTESSYLAGDLVFAMAEPAEEMGFLEAGILAYSTMPLVDEDGRLPDEGDPGALFLAASDSWYTACEAALWTVWHTRGNLQAETDCKLLQLSSKSFGARMKRHPHITNMAVTYAKTFVHLLNQRRLDTSLEPLTDLQTSLLKSTEMQEVFDMPAFSPTTSTGMGKDARWKFWASKLTEGEPV